MDLTSWGADLPATPRMGDLVMRILRLVPDLARLRISSIDSIEVDEALMGAIASETRLMPHLHLSLQAGDDIILKRMKRRHSRAQATGLVSALRARRPDLTLGADLIAGFPTEDAAAHQANLSIITELGLVHGHIFPYSPRPGTPAARMPQVDPQTIKSRASELRAAVASERGNWLQMQLGQPLEILAERDGTGHAPNFARVQLPPGTKAGMIVRMTPTRIVEGLLA